jgi:hypothetical protein
MLRLAGVESHKGYYRVLEMLVSGVSGGYKKETNFPRHFQSKAIN